MEANKGPKNVELAYEYLTKLEQESTRVRYATFTALASMSVVAPGLALRAESKEVKVALLVLETTLSELVFMLSFVFYLLAMVNFLWHRRYADAYRTELRAIEEKHFHFSVYRLRRRLTLAGNFHFHFRWVVILVGSLYGVLTFIYTGWKLFILSAGVLLIAYATIALVHFVVTGGKCPSEAAPITIERGAG